MLTVEEVKKLGNYYLDELKSHGRKFNPIKFGLNKRKSATIHGKAFPRYEVWGYDYIEINKHLVNKDEIINVILHELAHLDLAARGHGHGKPWKAVARLYGVWFNTTIKRTSDKAIEIPGSVEVRIVWNDKCLRLNKHLEHKEYKMMYSSEKRANNAIKKYQSWDFIESYRLIYK